MRVYLCEMERDAVNEKFFELSEEKRDAILSAGYRVFSKNSYRKSPMQEIADEAGISKSLLFHYFENKKAFYLYLWEYACQYSIEHMTEAGCYEETDFFKMLHRGMVTKMQILRKKPHMASFILKAYFENDPEVHDEIRASYQYYFSLKGELSLRNISKEQFVFGVDVKEIFRHIYWAAEGYLMENLRGGNLEAEKLERDFSGMIGFWKKIYGKRMDD